MIANQHVNCQHSTLFMYVCKCFLGILGRIAVLLDPSSRLATIPYTNITDKQTDRQTGQRSDSIGRTVLQTVAQKPLNFHNSAMIRRIAMIMTLFDSLKCSDGHFDILKSKMADGRCPGMSAVWLV